MEDSLGFTQGFTILSLKNGKVHYTGQDGNELYWMEDGVFCQRWIIACAEGTIYDL